jgi:hypothetical protein
MPPIHQLNYYHNPRQVMPVDPRGLAYDRAPRLPDIPVWFNTRRSA